jgi:hydrogenase maturation protease
MRFTKSKPFKSHFPKKRSPRYRAGRFFYDVDARCGFGVIPNSEINIVRIGLLKLYYPAFERLQLSDKNPFDDLQAPEIMILGVGCILYSDEGFGVRVIETLQDRYEFPDNVLVVDGGVLGINLLGVISKPDHLIVVDAIRNKGKPGDLYRLEGEAIPERIRAKNSLHQVDFLEALTLCQALDKVPETVILGVEPEDIDTLSTELTPTTQSKVGAIIEKVLDEVKRLGGSYRKKPTSHLKNASDTP